MSCWFTHNILAPSTEKVTLLILYCAHIQPVKMVFIFSFPLPTIKLQMKYCGMTLGGKYCTIQWCQVLNHEIALGFQCKCVSMHCINPERTWMKETGLCYLNFWNVALSFQMKTTHWNQRNLVPNISPRPKRWEFMYRIFSHGVNIFLILIYHKI